jgi:hypothetical protein
VTQRKRPPLGRCERRSQPSRRRSLSHHGEREDSVGARCLTKFCGRCARLCHDLGAAHTRFLTLLPPPSAVSTQATRRQELDYRGQQLHDSCRQTTIGTIEVPASTARTRCCEPKDLRWLHGARKSQELVAGRLWLNQVAKPRFCNRSSDHPEDKTARHVGLGARAKERQMVRGGVFHRQISPGGWAMIPMMILPLPIRTSLAASPGGRG